MVELPNWLLDASEMVKVVGSFASFYAVYKLRKIEQRYLFKATAPELIKSVQNSLSDLNLILLSPGRHYSETAEILSVLAVDIKNISRKAHGDTLMSANELLKILRPRRYFWQTRTAVVLQKTVLIDIYAKGMGLLRSIEHDMNDQQWRGK